MKIIVADNKNTEKNNNNNNNEIRTFFYTNIIKINYPFIESR